MDTPTIAPKKSTNPMMMTIIVGVVLAAAGFGGGMFFQKSQDSLKNVSGTALQKKLTSLGFGGASTGTGTGNTVNGGRFVGGAGFPGGFPGGRTGGGGVVAGSVVSADAQSVTVKEANGSTKVVYFTSTTTIDKSVTGAASDLTSGQNVVANGTANSDGSVAATTIQIRPAGATTTPLPTPAQ